MSEVKQPQKQSIRSQLFGLESNLKGIRRMIVVVLCLVVFVWVIVRFASGEKAANTATAALLQRPIELKNSIENLKATSSHGIGLNLPYSGTLSIEASVIRGNKIDIYLIPLDQWDNFKAEKFFNQFSEFKAEKTKNYKRDSRLSSGNYYLVFRDSSLGILSESTSDIKLLVNLVP